MAAKKLLEGKTALITGGSLGIGQAVAEIYAKNGASIILTARRKEALEAAAKTLKELGAPKVETLSVDLSDGAATEKLGKDLAARKDVDILVNNAGVHTADSIVDGDVDVWMKLLHLNLEAPLRLTHALLPSMLEKKEGAIINIGSLAGIEHRGKEAIYSASKHGVTGFSKSTHEQLINKGVKCVLLIPEMVASSMAVGRGTANVMIQPSDVAQAALLPFMMSKAAVPSEIVIRNTFSFN